MSVSFFISNQKSLSNEWFLLAISHPQTAIFMLFFCAGVSAVSFVFAVYRFCMPLFSSFWSWSFSVPFREFDKRITRTVQLIAVYLQNVFSLLSAFFPCTSTPCHIDFWQWIWQHCLHLSLSLSLSLSFSHILFPLLSRTITFALDYVWLPNRFLKSLVWVFVLWFFYFSFILVRSRFYWQFIWIRFNLLIAFLCTAG